MKNRIIAIALTLILVFTLTGCKDSFFEGKSIQGSAKQGDNKPMTPISPKFSLNEDGIDKINTEGIKIFDALMKEKGYKKNFILSPISIQRLLDLISMTISDRTELKALSLYDSNHLQGMTLANTKMESLILLNKDILKGKKIEKIPFDNVKFTEFPKQATVEKQELQKKVLGEVIDKDELKDDTSVALIDAIHYLSEWLDPFKTDMTVEDTFTTADGKKIKVPTMHGLFETTKALSDNDKDIFSLTAKNNAKVYFIKPKKNVEKTSSELQNMIKEYHKKGEFAEVDFYLPKVEFKTETDLMKLFEKIGLPKLVKGFELDRFIPNVPMIVSTAKQVATLKVDENGAEAKAVTTIEMRCTSTGPQELKKLTIKMDSPYYIVIEDSETSVNEPIMIFTAYVANPIEK